MSDNRLSLFLFLCLCLAAMGMLSSWSAAREISDGDVEYLTGEWLVHDMEPIEKDIFQVTGSDPFFTSWDLSQKSAGSKGFLFRISLDSGRYTHKLQCYWETESQPFQEVNSFHFVLNGDTEQYQIFIPYYFFDTRQPIRRIRLDVDPHTDHLVKVISLGIVQKVHPFLLPYIPKDIGYPEVTDISVFTTPVLARYQRELRVDRNWLLHDIQINGKGTLQISGKDPFLKSPELDLDLYQAKGIYLKIFSEGGSTPCKMQFFWKTYLLDYNVERRPFNEEDSYWFWLQFIDGTSEVYLPFRVIDPKDLLKAVRFDFVTCQNMAFAIQQVAIIEKDESRLEHLIPRQIAYKNMAAVPDRNKGGYLVVNWLCLLFRDRVFWIVYVGIAGSVILGIGYLLLVKIYKGCQDHF